MYSFQAKIGLIKRRRGENKNCCFILFRSKPTRNRKFPKKKKKFKNTIMASFQAIIDWKMPRKKKYKIYRSVSFLPDA